MTATEPRPADAPPRWDLTPFFPSLDSREFLGLNEEVGAEVGRLQHRFDELGVRAGEPLEVTDAVVATAEEVVESFNRLLTRMRRIGSYLYGHTTTDATDAAAAASVKEKGEPDLDRGKFFMQAIPATLARLADALLRSSPRPPLLVGPHGSGRSPSTGSARHCLSAASAATGALTPSPSARQPRRTARIMRTGSSR